MFPSSLSFCNRIFSLIKNAASINSISLAVNSAVCDLLCLSYGFVVQWKINGEPLCVGVHRRVGCRLAIIGFNFMEASCVYRLLPRYHQKPFSGDTTMRSGLCSSENFVAKRFTHNKFYILIMVNIKFVAFSDFTPSKSLDNGWRSWRISFLILYGGNLLMRKIRSLYICTWHIRDITFIHPLTF